jgi:hypothetical protein
MEAVLSSSFLLRLQLPLSWFRFADANGGAGKKILRVFPPPLVNEQADRRWARRAA